MKFESGEKVTWSSTSNGSTKAKTGVVVQVVPPKGRIDPGHRAYGLEGYGLPRDHESYVVHVPGKTEQAKGKRYWPRVSGLSVA